MRPYLPLHAFVQAGHTISTVRIVGVKLAPAPHLASSERVDVEFETIEPLWAGPPPARRHHVYERPIAEAAQVKFPDPVWGSVDVRQGATLLAVEMPGRSGDADELIYVDEFADPADAVLQSIKSILESERTSMDAARRFNRCLAWLRGGIVERLFAAECLVTLNAATSAQQIQVTQALSQAFAAEGDDYVQLRLGALLWDGAVPRVPTQTQVTAVNATLSVAGSTRSSTVRQFALERLSKVNLAVLRDPAVKPSAPVVRLLDEQRSGKTDERARQHLSEVMQALSR